MSILLPGRYLKYVGVTSDIFQNVTLATVLEADDILQECKADNKALIQL